MVFCVDEFRPLNLQPRPGRRENKEPGRAPRRRMRATYTRLAGVRHLFAAYGAGRGQAYVHIKLRKTRARFLEFCRYLCTLYPSSTQDRDHLRQLQPPPGHQAGHQGRDVGHGGQRRDRLYADEFILVSRTEAQFTALRYFALALRTVKN